MGGATKREMNAHWVGFACVNGTLDVRLDPRVAAQCMAEGVAEERCERVRQPL